MIDVKNNIYWIYFKSFLCFSFSFTICNIYYLLIWYLNFQTYFSCLFYKKKSEASIRDMLFKRRKLKSNRVQLEWINEYLITFKCIPQKTNSFYREKYENYYLLIISETNRISNWSKNCLFFFISLERMFYFQNSRWNKTNIWLTLFFLKQAQLLTYLDDDF